MMYLRSKELTEEFEGCKLCSYQDVAGIWTIGYGHTKGVYSGMVITKEQAEEYLDYDLQNSERIVNQYVTVPLTQNEFDALVDFVFNVGAGNFLHSTLLKLLNENKTMEAANEFEKWNHAGGKVVAGLTRRRLAEKELFLKV
jgi:lysozyme